MPLVSSLVLAAGIASSAPVVVSTLQTPALRACTLLTKELALTVTAAANKRVFDILPPEEERIGVNGTACEYGDIRVQIDAFTPAGLEGSVKKDGPQWVAVPNVGDRAWFRDNRGNYAELAVVAGAHTLTIQMGVPFQGTADKIKPNTIALANELLPRLR